jgi:hypothetical protein
LHELVKCYARIRCELWHKGRLGHAGLGVDLETDEATSSIDAIAVTEIRTAYAPAAKRHMRRQR